MNSLTNEQKLDEIYQYIQKQRSRELRAKIYRTVYIFAIIGGVYYISQHPDMIMKRVTDVVMPSVMENMKTMMTDDLMKQVQDAIPKQ